MKTDKKPEDLILDMSHDKTQNTDPKQQQEDELDDQEVIEGIWNLLAIHQQLAEFDCIRMNSNQIEAWKEKIEDKLHEYINLL